MSKKTKTSGYVLKKTQAVSKKKLKLCVYKKKFTFCHLLPEQKKPMVHFDHHRFDNNLHLLQSVSTELTTHTTPYQQLCRDKNKEFQCKVDLFFIKVRLHRNLRSNHNGYQSRFEIEGMV